MTKRFTLRVGREEIDALCRVTKEGGPTRFKPRYNIAPTQLIPVVRKGADGEPEVAAMQWGLIPFWATNPDYGDNAYNAPADDLAATPAFKYAVRRRRCLIPADGYYEWRDENGILQPYMFTLRGDDLFCFAGIWESWKASQGAKEAVETCSIVTCAPNAPMRPFRLQMPAILRPEQYALWLDTSPERLNEAMSVLKPYPGSHMSYFKVSSFVNDIENDAPQCVAALEEAQPEEDGESAD